MITDTDCANGLRECTLIIIKTYSPIFSHKILHSDLNKQIGAFCENKPPRGAATHLLILLLFNVKSIKIN